MPSDGLFVLLNADTFGSNQLNLDMLSPDNVEASKEMSNETSCKYCKRISLWIVESDAHRVPRHIDFSNITKTDFLILPSPTATMLILWLEVVAPTCGLIDMTAAAPISIDTFCRDGAMEFLWWETVIEWASLEKLAALHETAESASQFVLWQLDDEIRNAGELPAKWTPNALMMIDAVAGNVKWEMLSTAGGATVVFKIRCMKTNSIDEYELVMTGVRANTVESEIHQSVLEFKVCWNLTVVEELNVAKFDPNKNKFEDPVAGMMAGLQS